MKIKEYEAELELMDGYMVAKGGGKFSDMMRETVSIWSNRACMGYSLAAMKAAGLDPEQIREVLRNMNFNSMTVEEAEALAEQF